MLPLLPNKILYLAVVMLLTNILSQRTIALARNRVALRQTSLFSSSPSSSSPSIPQQRLERIISNRGVGSRSDVAKLFRQGRVSVGGKVIRSGSDKYPVNTVVEIDGEPWYELPLLAVYHKPTGIQSTLGEDRWGRANLEELSTTYPFLKTMHPVGRLDADTSGLLLFSSDGHVTQTLLNPTTGIEREYEAIVAGKVQHNSLKVTLAAGVTTTDGKFAAKLLESEELEDKALIPSLIKYEEEDDEEAGGEEEREEDKQDKDKGMVEVSTSFVRVAVTEGKYRMVRRVLHNAGHSVIELHRIRYGEIHLDELDEGVVRLCTEQETQWASQFKRKNKK